MRTIYHIVFTMMAFVCSNAIQLKAQANISVDLKPNSSDWKVSPLLFGVFSEENWGDLVPGIYEQYLVNPSFENWYDQAEERKTRLIWDDIKKTDGVAYPWEKGPGKGLANFKLSTGGFNSGLFQEIVLEGGNATLMQRLALPDYRVRTFRLSFHAEVSGDVKITVLMKGVEKSKKYFSKLVNLRYNNSWNKYEVEIKVPRSLETWLDYFGKFNLCFDIRGTGVVKIDQVTLFPSDCIEGIYNPETFKNFKDYNVKMIRWPGGNFTSGYHWKDGVGDKFKRPARINRSWGGIVENYLGTDEFLRFCELLDITPVIGVGYGEISKEEIADWVEYCNGDSTSIWGAIRKKNGRAKPYNVRYWGVGNEVYGSYQIGHTDSKTYAKDLNEIVREMKRRDSSIVILASGYGVHNEFRKTSKWNSSLLENAGQSIDLLDIHGYVYGPRDNKETNGARPSEVFQSLAASGYFFHDYLKLVKDLQVGLGQKADLNIALLEWSVLPHKLNEQSPVRQTFANFILSSLLFQQFIKQGEFVKMAAMHNFSLFVTPVKFHSEPPSPRSELFNLFNHAINGEVLPYTTSGIPAYNVAQSFEPIGKINNVPYLDVLAVRNRDSIYITVINRNTQVPYTVDLEFKNGSLEPITSYKLYSSVAPYKRYDWRHKDERYSPVIVPAPHIRQDPQSSITILIPSMSIVTISSSIKG